MIRLIPFVMLMVLVILASVIFSRDPLPITEDSPLWNCYTMGNLECGDE